MTDNTRPDPEAIVAEVRKSTESRVKVAIVDIDGVLRGKYILKDKFLSAVEKGFGFCDVVFGWDCADVCYDNVKLTGWHTGYPDANARLDLQTFRRVPWDDGVPFFLADFEDGRGGDLAACPRRLLKRVLGEIEDAGYQTRAGLEFEWFNFKETPDTLFEKTHTASRLTPLTPGMFGYSVLRAGRSQPYFKALMDELAAFGVPLEGLHTETGPGVFEAAIRYSEGLEAADRAALFKTGVKEIAARFDILPTFMARWNTSLPGSSGHIHHSLWSIDGTLNLFEDASRPDGMSDTFRHFIAGQIKAVPHLLPMLAPTVNSYKRLVEGFWAPTRMTWGIDNRTVALRVIRGGKATRLETRIGGADLNPYLALAALFAAGLYGIREKVELEAKPVEGNGYAVKDAPKLASNLAEAAQIMHGSELARSLLGDSFVDHFCATREWEWRQSQAAVTDWELKRYFEII